METNLQQFDELQANITVFLSPIKTLTVTDQASHLVASGALKTITSFKKMVDEKRVSLVKPLNDQVDAINGYAKKIKAPIEEAEAFVKNKMKEFALIEQKRIEEEKRRIQEEEQKERERIAAERKRQELALKTKQEEEAKKLEESKKASTDLMSVFGDFSEDNTAQEELKRKQEFERAEFEAKKKREEEEQQKQLEAKKKLLDLEKPKNTRKVWKWEVTAYSEIPDQYWELSEAMVNKAVKEGIREIPGIRIFQETEIVAR